MSEVKLIPAQPGWWFASVIREFNGNISHDDEVEVIAWRIEPIVAVDGDVEDFISTPVTIYGTLEGVTGIVKSPAGRWYSPEVDGSFTDKSALLVELKKHFDRRFRERAAV